MDVLVNNPLVDMYGPSFLLFYGALLAIFMVLARRTARAFDTSHRLPPLPVPENPNPYEIAFLRGGANEVTRLMVVELFQRGILVETPKLFLRQPKLKLADDVDLSSLDPALRQLAEKFFIPRDISTLKADSIKGKLSAQLEHWAKWATDEQLTFESAQRSASTRYGQMLLAVFLTVGAYKFAVALSKHHFNIAFLCMIALLGSFALLAAVKLPKFTARGRRYLEDLQTAYASFKNSSLPKPSEFQAEPSSAAWDPLLAGTYAMPVMAMGLFGASALQSAYYQNLRQRFTQGAGGQSCGGTGCGSSAASCGAGGGGGGGGGCGGGGCGGCGGCGG